MKGSRNGWKVEIMTIEQMFGVETDEEYIARTTEQERINEAVTYIRGIIAGGNYEDGYNPMLHVDDVAKKGYWSSDKTELIKAYIKGFCDGFKAACKED